MDRNHAGDRNSPLNPQRALQAVHEGVQTSIDPLGIAMPLAEAQLAWLAHPQELAQLAARFSGDLMSVQWHAWRRFLGLPGEDPILPRADDARFGDAVWRESAGWDWLKECYLLLTHSVQDALYATPGLSAKERRRAAFWWRNWLNAVAPGNFFWTNPVAMRKAAETRGESVMRGFRNFLADLQAGTVRMTDPEDFHVGENLATTRGAVVYRNRLLEVIHYAARTDQVRRLPVVIVTPWINKFYVLDLTPQKSLVNFLVGEGFSVFITSWKNPGADMREVTFDDYLTEGVARIVEVAQDISGSPRVHGAGYCIGGTALAMYMAWANRRYGDPEHVPVAHWTLFASLVDFHRPGDIEVFIDDGSVAWLTRSMEQKGFLDGRQMAAAFRLLRSNSLIWHYVVHGWLYGESPPPFDVLYWNMDTTRMPYAMHAWYLRELYLKNRLVNKDALRVAGEALDLARIRQPLYCVAAEDDHITPWQQVFRINHHVMAPKRFVLSSSGHILGIVNPPLEPPRREFRAADAHRADSFDVWLGRTAPQPGSWWNDWVEWLKPKCGACVPAPPPGSARHPALADAPGTYVLER